ncbi:amidohydrolase family protein [Hoeflea sp. Naph1]|uniref:amidohydrolase family protein n=1 Tax=Hoeflea sp. Naph1 TaxID=3388653 RepID=UPI0039900AD3
MFFDTHLHLIDMDRLEYPWLDEAPALRANASYEDYSRTARRVGITRTLHMEVDVAPAQQMAETEMVEELMALPDSLICGAIASCRPENEEFPAYLEKVLQRPAVRGLRRVLHVVPDEVSRQPLFRANLNRLATTRLTFDMCFLARQLPIAAELADACPDVTFVLDHGGVPDIRGGDHANWARDLRALAKRPNVIAKVSGFIAYADPDRWTLNDLRPYVETVIDAFGFERLVWGSDSPVVTLGGSIETWVAATQALIADCSARERALLTHENAEKLWLAD